MRFSFPSHLGSARERKREMGGGSLRTAAKAAILSQYRSPIPFFGRPSSSSSAPAPAPASGGIETRVPPPLISLPSGDNGWRQVEAGAAAELSSWDAVDWEFPAWKNEVDDGDDDDADLMSPEMRFVFRPVPTLAEAKEATSDLKVALDKSSSIAPPMPRPVVHAFSLLQESPEAQSVVASLACDKNVWDAVMKNQKVLEFYRNHLPISEGSSENASDPSADNSIRSVLADIMEIMKNNVRGMVSNVSNFLQDFFVASETYCAAIARGSSSHIDVTGSSTFVALAMLVIMVVLVKRESL